MDKITNESLNVKIEDIQYRLPANGKTGFNCNSSGYCCDLTIDWSGCTLADVFLAASKDIRSDFQNNHRVTAGQSQAQQDALVAFWKEINEKPHTLRVADKGHNRQVVVVKTISVDEQVASADEEELARMQAIIDARLNALKHGNQRA